MGASEAREPLQAFFAISTPRLILVPTPVAVSSKSYRALYAGFHADADFCLVAFGEHFKPRTWSDEETREVIETRDIARCWNGSGLGDFAVGLRPDSNSNSNTAREEGQDRDSFSVLRGFEYDQVVGPNGELLDGVEWAGYAGVRDATTTSLPPREVGDAELPAWREMVEIRYGFSSEFRGKGLAREAAEAVMQWARVERGVKRFIAETERHNQQSAKLLQRLGFVHSGTDYWKEPGEVEWELVVQ